MAEHLHFLFKLIFIAANYNPMESGNSGFSLVEFHDKFPQIEFQCNIFTRYVIILIISVKETIHTTLQELQEAITNAVNGITKETLVRVFDTLKNRVDPCVEPEETHFELML